MKPFSWVRITVLLVLIPLIDLMLGELTEPTIKSSDKRKEALKNCAEKLSIMMTPQLKSGLEKDMEELNGFINSENEEGLSAKLSEIKARLEPGVQTKLGK